VIDIAGEITGNASWSLSGRDAGQSGGTEPHEFSCYFGVVPNAGPGGFGARHRAQYLLQAIDDLINVLIRQLQAAGILSKHRDPIQMTSFRTLGRQPDVDDLLR